MPVQGQAVNGELGVGAVTGGSAAYLAVPTPVAGNLTFTSLSLGDKFSCGIAAGRAHCWVRGAGHCSLHSAAAVHVTSTLLPTAPAKLFLCFLSCPVLAGQRRVGAAGHRQQCQLTRAS